VGVGVGVGVGFGVEVGVGVGFAAPETEIVCCAALVLEAPRESFTVTLAVYVPLLL